MGQTPVMVLSILYLINTIVYILIEVRSVRRKKGVSVLFFVRTVYILIYGIVPVIVHAHFYTAGETVTTISYTPKGIEQLYYLYVLSVIGYIALNAGYALSRMKGKNGAAQAEERQERPMSAGSVRTLMIAATITLAVGFACFYLWSRAYGFPFGIMKYANLLRSGNVPVPNPWTFLKYFSTAMLFSSFLFFTILLQKDVKVNRGAVFVLFVFSGFWSVVYLLANDGRMSFVYFFLVFVLYQIIYKRNQKKSVFLKIIIWLGVAFVAMALADWIMVFLRNGQGAQTGAFSLDAAGMLRNELDFTILSGQTALSALEKGLAGGRFFTDVISGFLAFLPSSFRPEGISTLSAYNSAFIRAGYGETPTDFISMCVYDMGIAGVFVLSAVFGWLLRRVENYFAEKRGNGYYDMLFIIASLYLARFVCYADPANFVHATFFLAIGLAVVGLLNLFRAGSRSGAARDLESLKFRYRF